MRIGHTNFSIINLSKSEIIWTNVIVVIMDGMKNIQGFYLQSLLRYRIDTNHHCRFCNIGKGILEKGI